MSIFSEAWFQDLNNQEKQRSTGPASLPPTRGGNWDPAGYLPDDGLADAIRVALILRKPLLLTGEPGTGKTECAEYIAWKLKYERRLSFEAKSTSEARDLFYTYDSLGRFQAKSEQKPNPDPREFIHYNALGEAILQTRLRQEVDHLLPRNGWTHRGPIQSVVLIDEIDKAPRDFPNDLLNEIDRLYFRIPEMGNELVKAKAGLEPVIVITSNSEKSLPAAFLRRCIYYHIPFPEDRLEQIIVARLAESVEGSHQLLQQAVSFFLFLRKDQLALEKLPATAELLDWLLYFTQRGLGRKAGLLGESDGTVTSSLVTLLKRERDQKRTRELWNAWKQTSPLKDS